MLTPLQFVTCVKRSQGVASGIVGKFRSDSFEGVRGEKWRTLVVRQTLDHGLPVSLKNSVAERLSYVVESLRDSRNPKCKP